MATEILINDGGAPARILSPGKANVATESGLFVDINSSGKIIVGPDQEASQSGQKRPLGILAVDAVANGVTSVITGRGIVVNAQRLTGETLAAGDQLSVDAGGMLEKVSGADFDAHNITAVALGDGFTGTKADGSAAYFVKVLLV